MAAVRNPRRLAYRRMLVLSGLAALIGALAGLVARLLYLMIALVCNVVFFRHVGWRIPELQNHVIGLWVLVVPVLGGLVVGVMAKYGSSRIRGHGIPEAMEAVLVHGSRIAPKVAILKPLSAAISIGTGGPFGAEGPIIQTGGALGSLIGQILHTTVAERRVLLACGAAAGMAGVFSTPIAAVILAIELLLFEFRARSFIPLVIASTVATSLHLVLFDRGPMFTLPSVDFGIPQTLPLFVLLGLICGLAATLISRALYKVEDLYERLPIDQIWWPAIGGAGLGIIALFIPRVLGVGYGTISDILNDRLLLSVLAGIVVFKTLALLVSLGSGTSGGLLAPVLMVGAALGGAFAHGINAVVPGAIPAASAFALAGMAAVFGSASRATFTFIVFAFEITGDYAAVLPLMVATVVADLVTLRLMRHSIMTEKLARRGLRVHAEYEADVLGQVRVDEVMDKEPVIRSASEPLHAFAAELLAGGALRGHDCILLTGEDGKLTGLVTRGDVLDAIESEDGDHPIIEAGAADPLTCHPDDSVADALELMLNRDVGRLPVVARNDARQIVGYLGRAGVLSARMKRLKEEHERQPGWLARFE